MAATLDTFIKKSVKTIADSIDPDSSNFEASAQKALKFLINTVEAFKERGDKTDLDFLIKRKGLFYMFNYEAKGFKEKTLPFYDQFPLIFLLKVDSKGFLGINWHWISPHSRARLLIKLITKHPKTFFNDSRMIPIDYKRWLADIGANNVRFQKVAIRRYRFDALKKLRGLKVLRIPNLDMLDAIRFTTPIFKGITQSDAMKYIQRSAFAKNPRKTNVYKKYQKIMESKRPKKAKPIPKPPLN